MAENKNFKIDWDGDAVLIKLAKHSSHTLREVALATEAQAKVNINTPFQHKDGDNRGQVVTGDMLGATRAILDGSRLPIGFDAAVVSSATYAQWQEAIRPFLFPAAMTVAQKVRGIAVTHARGIFR